MLRAFWISFFLLLALIRPDAGAEPNFSRDILPILSDNCFLCHGPDEKGRKAKLRLDTKDGAFRVKDGVAVIIPGDSSKSELYRRITASDPDDVMPPPKSNRKLRPEQIALLKQWIDSGARWGEHWAFERIKRPSLPARRMQGSQALSPIDLFIFSRLEREGLQPNLQADQRTLIRRVSLDLTGLPPTLEEIRNFLGDAGPLAYERLLDRLLASPAFGERMAWDWLDVGRYADSNGYQGDGDRTMWPWRDWVVHAFNSNLPYDQFTLWQLAGDLLPAASQEQKLATAFCRNHPINGEGGRIAEENRVDYVMDMAETTGTAWLGLTLNCCRCHDHKFDPLTRRDYYSFFGFFNQTPVDGGGGDPQAKPNLDLPTSEQSRSLAGAEREIRASAEDLAAFEKNLNQETAAKLKKTLETPPAKRSKQSLADLEKEWNSKLPEYASRLASLRKALEKRDGMRGAIVRVMVMQDLPKPRDTFMLEKGIYDKRGDKVTAAIPARFGKLEAAAPDRLDLARWLVSPANPLTARVIVNRFWQKFFGIGLVKTPEDFGVQGEKPVHPELLDWLASHFVESGWDVKNLCRLIVTSAAYRQSSRPSTELLERDPENRLAGRGPRFRMPSWMIRDQALAASGLLVRRQGGAPVRPYQPPGIWEEATFGTRKYQQDHGAALYRRSLYIFWRRIVAPTMLFDIPSRAVCTVKEFRTNIPLHALVTLNETGYVEAARSLAQRALLGTAPSDAGKIAEAFERVLARPPTAAEAEVLLASWQRLRSAFADDLPSAEKFLKNGESPRDARLDPVEHAAFTAVCLAILNMDEALTKE